MFIAIYIELNVFNLWVFYDKILWYLIVNINVVLHGYLDWCDMAALKVVGKLKSNPIMADVHF